LNCIDKLSLGGVAFVQELVEKLFWYRSLTYGTNVGRGGAEVPSGFKFKWRFFERRNTERLFIKAARGDFRV